MIKTFSKSVSTIECVVGNVAWLKEEPQTTPMLVELRFRSTTKIMLGDAFETYPRFGGLMALIGQIAPVTIAIATAHDYNSNYPYRS